MDDIQTEREPIGSILLKRRLINEDQLKEALEYQQVSGGHLGEILVDKGILQELDVVVALMTQYGLPYIAVNKYRPGEKILKLVPQEMAVTNLLVPLDRVGKILSVVMADPLNREVIQRLEEMTGFCVTPFIATKTEIVYALQRWYGVEP